jgi:hypothetical protein
MKLAVFQICEGGARPRLICIEMPSLQSAANLEHWLKMNAAAPTEITLLGRFDSVCVAASEEQAERLILPRATHLHANGGRDELVVPGD